VPFYETDLLYGGLFLYILVLHRTIFPEK